MANNVLSYEDKIVLSTSGQKLLDQLETLKETPFENALIEQNLIKLMYARAEKKSAEEDIKDINLPLLKYFRSAGITDFYKGKIVDADIRVTPDYKPVLAVFAELISVEDMIEFGIVSIRKKKAEEYASLHDIDIPDNAYETGIKSKWVEPKLKIPKI
ncbi:MAG: hypothetical protein KAJ56_02825 [Candidatus Aenigmarchaeota archaeon]|nr:hypothetical protein [Candidatus Aenigmarchaeota archaeon]